MNARKKKVICVLVVAAPLLLWRITVLTKYLPAQVSAAPAVPEGFVETAPPVVTNEKTEAAARARRALEEVLQQPWGRDPFAPVALFEPPRGPDQEEAPPVEAPKPPAEMLFSSVSKSGSRWMAIVNDRIVSVGDRVDGEFEIVEINKNTLTLRRDGWFYRYELGKKTPKVESPGEGR